MGCPLWMSHSCDPPFRIFTKPATHTSRAKGVTRQGRPLTCFLLLPPPPTYQHTALSRVRSRGSRGSAAAAGGRACTVALRMAGSGKVWTAAVAVATMAG